MRLRLAFLVLVVLTACKKEEPPPPAPPVASASAAASAEVPFDHVRFRDAGLGGRRHRFRVNDAGAVEVGD